MCVSIELTFGADLQYAKHAGINPSLDGADLRGAHLDGVGLVVAWVGVPDS
jgi:hypothetical protein